MATQLQLATVQNTAKQRRIIRRPKHKFFVSTVPFAITPFLCAPVLPGETMENLLLQSRCVTDPVASPLIGWWLEHYIFYIPHRGLAKWDTGGLLQNMMLDPSTDVSSLKAAANNEFNYTFKGGMDYVAACKQAVVEHYFRDEDEEATAGVVAVGSATHYRTLAKANGANEDWTDSLKTELGGADDDELPGVDEQEELDKLPGFDAQYAQWELMRDHGLTDATYEDYLRSYGVSIPVKEDTSIVDGIEKRHVPELLRYSRDFKYPSNTVDPTSGAPTSAVSWLIGERADKARFFKEPGFIFGVTVCRPKLYLGSQKGSAVGLLDNPYAWLPAVLSDHPYTSMKENAFSATDGILQNQSGDYWVDLKDLYLYGDQFVSGFPLPEASVYAMALPDAALNKSYPTADMIKNLFADPVTYFGVRQDGVCHLNIRGRIKETT